MLNKHNNNPFEGKRSCSFLCNLHLSYAGVGERGWGGVGAGGCLAILVANYNLHQLK